MGYEEGLDWLKKEVGIERVKTDDPGRIRLLVRRDMVLFIIEDPEPTKYKGLYMKSQGLAEQFCAWWQVISGRFR